MCPACGGGGTEPLLEKDGFHYVACIDCGSARIEPIPALDLADFYGRSYFEGGSVAGGYAAYGIDEPVHRRNAAARLEIVHQAGFEPPGRILELGSGYGYFLDEARKQGWTVSGVDISPHARRVAAGLGLDVVPETLDGDSDVDILAAFQVLEHMQNPRKALAAALDRLAAGGLVMIETWDRSHWAARVFRSRWQQISPPAVMHLFTEAGLRTLAAGLGLAAINVKPTPKLVSLGAVAGQLAIDYPAAQRAFSWVRESAAGQRAARYGFGDLVTLTARKPR